MPAVLQYAGVFLKDKDVWDNTRKLASYLGFPNTGAMRAMMDENQVKGIIEGFCRQYDQSFGHTGPSANKAKTLPFKRILDGFSDPAIKAKLDKAKDIDDLCSKYTSDTTVTATILTIQNLHKAKPQTFTDTNPREDIRRAFGILRHAIKSRTASRKTKNPKNQPAVEVQYHSPNAEEEGGSSSQDEQPPPAEDKANYPPIGPIDDMETGDVDINEENEDFDALDTLASDLRGDATMLPTLSAAARSRLLASISHTAPDISFADTELHQMADNEQLQHAMSIEGGTGQNPDDNVDAETIVQQDFLKLNRQMNSASAPAPLYSDACSSLGFCPDKPEYAGVVLEPWQVTGIAWMKEMEEKQQRGGILGDECGLGKTLQCFGLVDKAAAPRAPPYAPTLIVAPSTLVDSWLREFNTTFANTLRLKLYYGTIGAGGTTDPVRQRYIVAKTDLGEQIRALDPNDVMTERTIVLTSYSTWHSRTLEVKSLAPGQGSVSGRAGDGALAREDDDEQPEELDDNRISFESTWPSELKFRRAILDEGHAIKNTKTRFHQSVSQLPVDFHWIVTATSMINKVNDLYGFLELLYQERFASTQPDYRDLDDMVEVYRKADSGLSEDLHILHPHLYRRLLGAGTMSPAQALVALPRILMKVQLRRFMGARMALHDGSEVTIGESIRPYRITTINCQLDSQQLAFYTLIHRDLVESLKSGATEDDTTKEMGGKFDMRIYRRLRHASFSYGLESLYQTTTVRREGNLAADIAKWREKPGGGLQWILSRMVLDPSIPFIPNTQDFIAQFMCNLTPKFPTLAKIVASVVLDQKSRLLVFNAYPTTQFLTEQFLKVLGFKVKVLRAGMSTQERSLVAANFNDAASDIDILVVTYATCSLGLNLHHSCHNLVLLEPAINANTSLQAIGRVHRLGQERAQRVWLLSSPHTFDAFLEGNQARKLCLQIIGMGHRAFEGENREDDQPSDDNDRLVRIADSMFQKLFGMSESRYHNNEPKEQHLSGAQLASIRRLAPKLPLQAMSAYRVTGGKTRDKKQKKVDSHDKKGGDDSGGAGKPEDNSGGDAGDHGGHKTADSDSDELSSYLSMELEDPEDREGQPTHQKRHHKNDDMELPPAKRTRSQKKSLKIAEG